MTVSFPFEQRSSNIFSVIYRPIALVLLWSTKISDWMDVPMIVDTGADYTILPSYQSQNLGVDLEKDCRPYQTQGVGGSDIVYLLQNYRVKQGCFGQDPADTGRCDGVDAPVHFVLGQLGGIFWDRFAML